MKSSGITKKKLFGRGTPTRNRPISYLMILPWFLLFFIFTVLPVLASMVLSFTDFDMLQAPNFNGISNYLRLLLDDDIFLISLKNTIILAIVTGPIGYILSFLFAWGINDMGRGARSVLTLAFYTPSLAGNVYFIWQFFFSGDSRGVLNAFLLKLGVLNSPIDWLNNTSYNMTICIIVILWMSAGTGFLAFVAGLQSLNNDLSEAGALDGIRNRWQELWFITLPQMKPQLLVGAVFSISGAFGVGYQNAALTGNPSTDYSTHTLVLHITDYAFTRYEMGYASTISVILFLMMLLMWRIFNKGLSKWNVG